MAKNVVCDIGRMTYSSNIQWLFVCLGLKKNILFVSDFRPTLLKHVRPKFILWISKKKKKKKIFFFFFFFLGNQ